MSMAPESVDNNALVDWKPELSKAAFKYHVIVAWVAVILNPLWAVSDYFNIPSHFTDFLIFRLAVSFVTLFGIVFKDKLKENPVIIAFIPFIGISVQNAYMYSVMDVEELQKHTFAYIALFIGAGMFVLWRPVYSVVIVILSFIANIIFFYFNSHLPAGEVLINGGMLTASVALFTILLINTRTNLTRKEIIARLSLAESNKQLAEQKNIVDEKNKDIQDSINYARRIQRSILPPEEHMKVALHDYFVLYKPQAIISGDFYWMSQVRTSTDGAPLVVLAVVDCTGHGVPGALMSIVGNTLLNQTIKNPAINTPAEALDFLNHELPKNLKQQQAGEIIRDGMDMVMCAINYNTLTLYFSGANNPICILRDGEIIEIKGDKQGITGSTDDIKKPFTNHTFQLRKNDMLYMFTDGFADQFGGPDGKKFRYKNLQKEFIQVHSMSLKAQREYLSNVFDNWKGDLDQVDDVTIIGVRI
ncbi:MAG: SpoIIE family protein phosphatase [Bacteroidetes bacterium]|nr:SpoIIE family protein phosphatase [Bacteroidota bacterium]